MYFDPRLWQFTQGVRLRIAASVLIGILAAGFGIARLALLGWLLAKVFQGASFAALVLPFAVVVGVMVAVAGVQGGCFHAIHQRVHGRMAGEQAMGLLSGLGKSQSAKKHAWQ